MVGLLDEHNIIADIDALPNKQSPRRELASPTPGVNSFKAETTSQTRIEDEKVSNELISETAPTPESDAATAPFYSQNRVRQTPEIKSPSTDLIASLFGLIDNQPEDVASSRQPEPEIEAVITRPTPPPSAPQVPQEHQNLNGGASATVNAEYKIQVSGPGVNTSLSITEEEDIAIAVALLEKIRRQLKAKA
jgi:hypothetical protein